MANLIFVLAFLIRVYFLQFDALLFTYDQARDAYVVKNILQGDLKVQGPPTSNLSSYHGVLYYYLITPAYLVGKGDPRVVAYSIAFLSSLGVFVIYACVRKIGLSRKTALLSAILFACSYELSQYATHLSNSSIAVITVPYIYLGLILWMRKKSLGAIYVGLGLGLSVQANLALAYHLWVVAFLFLIRFIKVDIKDMIRFVLCFILAVFSMLIAEIKFGLSHVTRIQPSMNLFIWSLSRMLAQLFTGNFLGYVSVGFLITKVFRHKWLLVILLGIFSFVPALIIGGQSTPHLDVGLASLVLIATAIFLERVFDKSKFIGAALLILVVSLNLQKIKQSNIHGQELFAIQKAMILKNQLAVINFIYQDSDRKPFSINTLTAPLYINTTWSYLFNWYGYKTYGYLPYWHGRDQIDLLGNNLVKADKNIKTRYLIIEPLDGIPIKFATSYIDEEKQYGDLVQEHEFDGIKVQKRIIDKL